MAAIYICLFTLFNVIALSKGDIYTVKITAEQHVNLVDSRFLSFTIDPKYLFSTSEKFSSKECICMASSMSPAYLRVAGPSTAYMSFYNTTITISDVSFELRNEEFEVTEIDSDAPKKVPFELMPKKLSVTHREWRKFVNWAKSIGFSLVFALNNNDRTSSGMWDPNTALNVLTVAEKAKVGDIFWELGYECTNQTIEDYLNDLETLRVIIETFPPGRTGEWKVVGGDVSKCLQADCKSDFKDYITMSEDMMDALLLNGNSSAHELERMSEIDRMRLLRFLYHSQTPLWLTENNQRKYNQLERAADWLTSLGYSAKHGFSVNYRELEEEEMYEPTLSFYMALLFKNLVGERVLNVEMTPDQAILFAHCTSLRHKPIPSAITFFGVNMDDEPARFALKLPKQEEGGDIMQFILGHDHSGNIIVNGRAMYYEGDIRPVVKRVRPYKTLLINLPPKSFGFWVLANTKIAACHDKDDNNKTFDQVESVTEKMKVKRSINYDFEDLEPSVYLSHDFEDSDLLTTANKPLNTRISDIKRGLNDMRFMLLRNIDRSKRNNNNHFGSKISLRQILRNRNKSELDFNAKTLLGNIFQKAKQGIDVLKTKGIREVKRKFYKNRVSKRQSKKPRYKTTKSPVRYTDDLKFASKKRQKMNKDSRNINKIPHKKYYTNAESNLLDKNIENKKKISTGKKNLQIHSIENQIAIQKDIPKVPNTRKRRQLDKDSLENENDIEVAEDNDAELWKMLKKIQGDLKDFSDEHGNKLEDDKYNEGILVKTKLSDDTATIHVKDSSKGLISSAMKNVVNVLEDLNSNLSRFWDALSFLE